MELPWKYSVWMRARMPSGRIIADVLIIGCDDKAACERIIEKSGTDPACCAITYALKAVWSNAPCYTCSAELVVS